MKESDCHYVSVYGSLRRDTAGKIHPLLEPAEFLGSGWFAGTLYDLGEFPGAIVTQNLSRKVKVEIYRLLSPETAWAGLDEYEDCDPARKSDALFHRTILAVELDSGGQLSTWVYLYNRSTETLSPIQSGDWVSHP
ncbi:MAG: gamma-glutamylcyclotransferase [Verrucomicrobia bacterium]|nr:gamma-glutamylcyclotransferase [Verrucomicrobiota bacterium]